MAGRLIGPAPPWGAVTQDFGLIQALMPQLLSAFEDWQRPFEVNFMRTEVFSSLADAFESLMPLSNSKMRRLFVATQSDWVACFQNNIQGSDPFPARSYLAQRMEVLAMRVCCTPDDAVYPAVMWEYMRPRLVAALRHLDTDGLSPRSMTAGGGCSKSQVSDFRSKRLSTIPPTANAIVSPVKCSRGISITLGSNCSQMPSYALMQRRPPFDGSR
jgi:hypothetical protein